MNWSGNRLKELRESLQLSVDEFSKALGIHRSSLYRYEGTNKAEPREIPITLAIEISEKFGISLDWLAGNSEMKYINQTPNKLTEIYELLPETARQELFNYAMYLKSRESDK